MVCYSNSGAIAGYQRAADLLSDQKKKMEEDQGSRSDSSQLSLVRTRDSTVATPTVSPAYEMTGAIQDTEDDGEVEITPPGRVDTEMGGRFRASGLEGSPSRREPQRSYEMTDTIQDIEDDGEVGMPSPRRIDTEMEGRFRASGLEGSPSRREPQRRPTFPPKRDHGPSA